MRIPGGDLAPARRRQYGGSYGRRRHRRNTRMAAALVLLVAGGGAAYALREQDAGVPQRIALGSCPSPTATPSATPSRPPATAAALPRPQQISLTVLNGTSRDMLAKRIGDELAAQGFTIAGQANASQALAGSSRVTFGVGGGPSALRVARWVPGSKVTSNPKAQPGAVQLTLGSDFVRLATAAEAARAGQPAAAPAPTASAVASKGDCAS